MASSKGKKGQRSGKGRGKDPRSPAKSRRVSGWQLPAAKRPKTGDTPPVKSTVSVPASSAASVAEGSVTSKAASSKRPMTQTEVEKMLGQADKYAATKLEEALEGNSMKAPLYRSNRILQSLSEVGQTDSTEYINLKARVELLEQAVTLHDHLSTLGVPQREEATRSGSRLHS